MSYKYPLFSSSWLFFYGSTEAESREYVALLLPEYNNPKITGIDTNEIGNIKSEYFFYHDNNFIIYERRAYGVDHIQLRIYKQNMNLHQVIRLKLEEFYDYNYVQFKLSPSGRYIFYVEDEKKEDPNDTSEPVTVGKVVELVMDKETLEFKLELRREIRDFYERYKKRASDVNQYSYYGSIVEFFVSDKMEIMALNKNENFLMYEDIHCYAQIENKFGMRDYEPEKYKDLNDITIIMKNGGFAIHTEEEAYFLRVNSEIGSVLPVIKINFKINKSQMTIHRICPCIDPSLIVISLVKEGDYLLLVWNIEENREVSNFSTSKNWSFINGSNNKAGFIMNGSAYVNLDRGVVNYFFEYEFTNNGFYEQTGGYKINEREDVVLEYGNLITKETVAEVTALQELIRGEVQISEETINIERIRFQVDGSTSIHLFALEYDTLTLILDYMQEHKPEYLTAILMKNKKNKSPLDITLDNESPKNTELLLRKLIQFKDENMSNLFFDRFNELLAMNITIFYDYLESCFFQTVQMKGIKYLKLKDNAYPLMIPHSSCLIDEIFVDKYCKTEEKKNLEQDKKKIEEEQGRPEEEQKRLDEVNKKEEDKNYFSDIKESEMEDGNFSNFYF
jgi:hypothetical protein